jgi:hypothetical protein
VYKKDIYWKKQDEDKITDDKVYLKSQMECADEGKGVQVERRNKKREMIVISSIWDYLSIRRYLKYSKTPKIHSYK